MAAAGKFIEGVGFALLFPADPIVAPSLYEAVAGPDAVPWSGGMGVAESAVWEWKDALPERAAAWYGKFLFRRGCLLSPELLRVLYQGKGELDDHRGFELCPDAHRVADALLLGPLTSAALREVVGDKNRYERAISELQRNLLVTSAGVQEQRTGWPVTLMDLTSRRFAVGGQADRETVAACFLRTMLAAKPSQLARAFGWPTAIARSALETLVATGRARSSGDGLYRLP